MAKPFYPLRTLARPFCIECVPFGKWMSCREIAASKICKSRQFFTCMGICFRRCLPTRIRRPHHESNGAARKGRNFHVSGQTFGGLQGKFPLWKFIDRWRIKFFRVGCRVHGRFRRPLCSLNILLLLFFLFARLLQKWIVLWVFEIYRSSRETSVEIVVVIFVGAFHRNFCRSFD